MRSSPASSRSRIPCRDTRDNDRPSRRRCGKSANSMRLDAGVGNAGDYSVSSDFTETRKMRRESLAPKRPHPGALQVVSDSRDKRHDGIVAVALPCLQDNVHHRDGDGDLVGRAVVSKISSAFHHLHDFNDVPAGSC